MNANRRMTLTVAFACALSSIGLYPLFIGSAWFYAGLGAIITVAASGALQPGCGRCPSWSAWPSAWPGCCST